MPATKAVNGEEMHPGIPRDITEREVSSLRNTRRGRSYGKPAELIEEAELRGEITLDQG